MDPRDESLRGATAASAEPPHGVDSRSPPGVFLPQDGGVQMSPSRPTCSGQDPPCSAARAATVGGTVGRRVRWRGSWGQVETDDWGRGAPRAVRFPLTRFRGPGHFLEARCPKLGLEASYDQQFRGQWIHGSMDPRIHGFMACITHSASGREIVGVSKF